MACLQALLARRQPPGRGNVPEGCACLTDLLSCRPRLISSRRVRVGGLIEVQPDCKGGSASFGPVGRSPRPRESIRSRALRLRYPSFRRRIEGGVGLGTTKYLGGNQHKPSASLRGGVSGVFRRDLNAAVHLPSSRPTRRARCSTTSRPSPSTSCRSMKAVPTSAAVLGRGGLPQAHPP